MNDKKMFEELRRAWWEAIWLSLAFGVFLGVVIGWSAASVVMRP